MIKTLSSRVLCREAEKSSSGVFYIVPKNKEFSIWEIVYFRGDEVEEEELFHEKLWEYVLENLKPTFELSEQEIDSIRYNEAGLPRGRVLLPKDTSDPNNWLIIYGSDVPPIARHQILKAFGLHGLNEVGKIVWEESDQEQINELDKEKVWKILRKGTE